MSKFLSSLPSSGIAKLVLTGVCIIATVLISSLTNDTLGEAKVQCLSHVTLYISFALSGLLDIFAFYTATGVLIPKQSDGLVLSLAFLIETLLVNTIGDSDQAFKLTVASCLVFSLLKLLNNSSILHMGLMVMTMLQGTWLIHLTFLETEAETNMIYLYYSWHTLAVFVINLIFNIVLHCATKYENVTKSRDSFSNPTGLTVMIRKDRGNSVDDLSSGGSSMTTPQTMSMSTTDSTATDQGETSDEGESRVSPLEEFNTLHRHTEGVRKSIKLKESSIV